MTTNLSATEAKKFNPDPTDIKIMLRIAKRKTLMEMGEELGIVSSTIQYRVDRMVAAGLIEKNPDGKKKARSLTLTPAAVELFGQYNAEVKVS